MIFSIKLQISMIVLTINPKKKHQSRFMFKFSMNMIVNSDETTNFNQRLLLVSLVGCKHDTARLDQANPFQYPVGL